MPLNIFNGVYLVIIKQFDILFFGLIIIKRKDRTITIN